MKIIIITPAMEPGKNGKMSFSRTKSNAYIIWDKIPFDRVFGQNTEKYAYLTITGAKILARLAKSGNVGVLAENFELNTKYSDNMGNNGEWTLFEIVPGLTPGTKSDDIAGIDGWWYGEPIQIKTCTHGLQERCIYAATDMKKSGISVINASVADLYAILDK